MIKVRKAKDEDAQIVEEIRKQTWISTYPNKSFDILREDIELIFEDESYHKNKFLYELASGARKYLLAEIGSEIVGFITIEEKSKHNEIYALYVLEEYQGQGVGKTLLREAMKLFKDSKPILLRVTEYNDQAINFYRSKGFKITTFYPLEDYELPNGKTIPVVWMKYSST